ncbi:IscS subfamily cysteine desulfurase [Alkalibacillus aidingensis]|uniref:IscS subfamily cysteine desulfurase n=1 Tax=Alkalibacillus aidingensis TaxID=2747607 RepID=UPI0016601EB5|nr:IscS subfamily cysteine desulfurase [Alkalibacillus aidingensis]
MIYFDYAATTPMSEVALEAYVDTAKKFYGNTNSLHDIGSVSDQLLKACKAKMASFIGGLDFQIFFTKGGSESNLLGIDQLISQSKGNHVIISQAEHNSLQQTRQLLESQGYQVSTVSFDEYGVVDLVQLKSLKRDDTCLVIVQHINGEIGTIQPINEISDWCSRHGIFLHVDAVQSFAKLDLSQIAEQVDSLSVSSHKIYGPKGIGFLYLRNPLVHQIERQSSYLLKGNTVDLPSVVAFTAAADQQISIIESENERMLRLRQLMMSHLGNEKAFTIYESDEIKQLPSIVGMGLDGVEGQLVMLECNRKGFAISTGSACDVKYQKLPSSMSAWSVEPNKAKEFFRVSFGKYTTEDDVIKLARVLNDIVLHHVSI